MISIKDLPKEVKGLVIDSLRPVSPNQWIDGAIIRRAAYTISLDTRGLKLTFHASSLGSDQFDQLIRDYYRAIKGAK
jgi:hypothetical protein